MITTLHVTGSGVLPPACGGKGWLARSQVGR